MRACVLLLAGLCLSLAAGKKDVKSPDKDHEGGPLDFLTFSTNHDLEIDFGYEIIEHIHSARMECEIKKDKEELKFTEKLALLMRYHKQTKKFVYTPEFESLSLKNKEDIEDNFRATFSDIEYSHMRRLDKLQLECDAELDDFMQDRLRRAVYYANNVLSYSREDFNRLITDMLGYQSQLHYGLRACVTNLENIKNIKSIQHLKFYDRCFGSEVEVLIEFITNFTKKAGELVDRLDGKQGIVRVELPSQEPEGGSGGSGDGTTADQEEGDSEYEQPTSEKSTHSENTGDKEDKTTKPEEKSTDSKDNDFSKDKSDKKPDDSQDDIKAGKDDKEEPGQDDIKEKPDQNEKIQEDKTTDKSDGEVATEESPSDQTTAGSLSEEEVAEWFKNIQAPGPVIIDPPEKPTADEEIADRAFKKVKEMEEAGKSSKSTNNEQLSVELDLPGVSLEVGPGGVVIEDQQGDQEVVFEYKPTSEPTGAPEGHSFKTLFFIYFFSTLGALIGLTLLVTIVTIVCVRVTSRKAMRKDTPLLSEEAKIDVMKKSGYVNPTYHYFDQEQDV